jgi:hypothetical protein
MSDPDDYIGDRVPIRPRSWVIFGGAIGFLIGVIFAVSHKDAADNPTPVRYCYDVPRDQYDGGDPNCKEGR